MLLKEKNVIITGATRGIGKGIAHSFAEQGANIAFTFASSVERARQVTEELAQYNTKIKAYRSDASDYDAAQELIADIIKDFGSVDVLVNNAGITKDNLLMRMKKEDWTKVIQVNLNSVFNMTKAVLRPMLKQRKGSIVNMASVVGVKGNAGQSNYAASKAGIIGFSKSIAQELGSRNIRCNVVAPGFIETEMTEILDEKIKNQWIEGIPLKRVGSTKDVANACLFYACDMSAYVTGDVMNVNGGMYT